MKTALAILFALCVVGCGPNKGGIEGTWVAEPRDDYSETERHFVTLQLDGSWSSAHVHLRSEEKDWTRVGTYYVKGGVIHAEGKPAGTSDSFLGIEKYVIRGDGNLEELLLDGNPSVPRIYKKQP